MSKLRKRLYRLEQRVKALETPTAYGATAATPIAASPDIDALLTHYGQERFTQKCRDCPWLEHPKVRENFLRVYHREVESKNHRHAEDRALAEAKLLAIRLGELASDDLEKPT